MLLLFSLLPLVGRGLAIAQFPPPPPPKLLGSHKSAKGGGDPFSDGIASSSSDVARAVNTYDLEDITFTATSEWVGGGDVGALYRSYKADKYIVRGIHLHKTRRPLTKTLSSSGAMPIGTASLWVETLSCPRLGARSSRGSWRRCWARSSRRTTTPTRGWRGRTS